MKRMRTLGSLFVFLFLASAVRAEITQIVVTVDGVACPFCVYGIEKKLNQVDGVEGVEISLKAGTAPLRTAEGKVPTIEALRTAVTKAGFTVLDENPARLPIVVTRPPYHVEGVSRRA